MLLHKTPIKKVMLLVCLSTIATLSLFAQQLTFTSYDLELNGVDTVRIGELTLGDCSYSLHRLSEGNLFWNTDITLDTDSNYYHFYPFTFTPGNVNKLVKLEFEPFQIGLHVEQFPENKEGMTCDKQGNLYLAGESLSRWQNGQITELGSLPTDMHCRGDLTFRQGKLYLSSIENTLVEVDLDDPMNSTVVMTFPFGTPEIHGLATVNLECDSVETYAVGSIPFGGGSAIYRIDFDTWQLEEICQFDFYITGLASYDECIFPDCTILVDLDVDNSAGAVDPEDFRYEQVCTFPVPITDTDVSLHSDLEMLDSIAIALTNPMNANESLFLASSFNVDILQYNPHYLVLVNNGNSDLPDFIEALQNVFYNNDNSSIVYGERIIEVRAHFGFYQSSLSRCFIPTNEVNINPGLSIDSVSCFGFSDGVVSSTPSGSLSPFTYNWSFGLTDSLVADLQAGTYDLTISDGFGCSQNYEVIIPEPENFEAFITNVLFDTICGNAGTLLVSTTGGNGGNQYLWSNNIMDQENTLLSPDTYEVTVSDINDCVTITSYTLEEGEDQISYFSGQYCFNETVEIQGQSFDQDTSFCLTVPLANGCDSLYCYELSFFDLNVTFLPETICEGDSVLILGNYYSSDTLIQEFLSGQNNCDSIVNHSLFVFEPMLPELQTNGSLCEEEEVVISSNNLLSYEWSTGENMQSITVDQAGQYSITVTDINGCTATETIQITDDNFEIDINIIDPSCFNFDNGSISIETIDGGLAPFVFQINEEPEISVSESYDNLLAGSYSLTVLDENNCSQSLDVMLINPEEIILQGDSTFITAPGIPVDIRLEVNVSNASIQWIPEDNIDCPTCFESSIIVENDISYEVIITDEFGCTVSSNVNIEIDKEARLFVPNVFSPNNDNINDALKVYGSASVSRVLDLTIMSRNGHAVYKNENFFPDESQEGWDGTFLGQLAQTGVYILYVKYEDVLGQVKQDIYSLTLVR